jgi:lipopolysaccharide export system permease protein
MRILDRERYWAFLKAYVICFVALISLYIVIDAFTNLDEFNKVADGVLDLFRRMGWYYLIKASLFYDRLCGVMTMMAAIFAVTWMQRNNELLAMLAAGISAQRVIRPVIVSGVIVSAVAIVNQEYIMPAIGAEELMKKPDDESRTKLLVTVRSDANDVLIHGKEGDRKTPTIRTFNATLPSGLLGTMVEIEAQQGLYIPRTANFPRRGGWLLRGVKLTPPDAPIADCPLLIPIDEEELKRYPPPLPEKAPIGPKAYFLISNVSYQAVTRDPTWFQFSATPELIRGLSDPVNGYERVEMAVFLHMRLLRPLLSLILIFLSLPQVLGGGDRNMFINLGLSLGTSAVFYGVSFATQYLGNNAVIPPEMAAWAPAIGFGVIAAARWDRIRT